MTPNPTSSQETLTTSTSTSTSTTSLTTSISTASPPSSIHTHPIPTFPPATTRLIQIVGATIHTFFAAGIIFGFAALKPILRSEGIYREICSSSSPSPSSFFFSSSPLDHHDVNNIINNNSSNDNDATETCIEMRLNMIFVVAAVTTNLAALPVGVILDSFGPQKTSLLGAILLSIGAIFLAFASEISAVAFWGRDLGWMGIDGYLMGYLFLALGGSAVFISSFHLSNSFPTRSGLVLALLTGAFDASSALFLGYRVVYERAGGRVGLRGLFLAYLIVPVYVVLLHLTVMPKVCYPAGGWDVVEDGDTMTEDDGERVGEYTPLLGGGDGLVDGMGGVVEGSVGRQNVNGNKVHVGQKDKKMGDKTGVTGILHGLSAFEQIKTPWFILICLFTTIQMLRLNYFIATIRPQYLSLLLSPAQSEHINHIFDTLLPLGGIISIPLIGHILDTTSSSTALTILATLAALIGTLGLVPRSVVAALANIALFVVYRPFFYTAIADYVGRVFGFATFGVVYGTLIAVAGVGTLGQGGLDYLFYKVCQGDPFWVNLGLLVAGAAAGGGLVAFVVLHEVRRRKKGSGNENGIA